MFPSGRPTQLRPVKLVHLNHMHTEQNVANKVVEQSNKCTNEQSKAPFNISTNVMRTDSNCHVNNNNYSSNSSLVRAPVITSRVEQNLQRWRAFGVNVDREHNYSSQNLTSKLRDILEANSTNSNSDNNNVNKSIQSSRGKIIIDKDDDNNVNRKKEQSSCNTSQHNVPRSFLSSVSFNSQTLDTHITDNNKTEKVKEAPLHEVSENEEYRQEIKKTLEVTSTVTCSTGAVADHELKNSTSDENSNNNKNKILTMIDENTNKTTSNSLREHLREVARKVAEDMERRKCGAPKANTKKTTFALSTFRKKKAMEQKKENELQLAQKVESSNSNNINNANTTSADNNKKKIKSNKKIVQEEQMSINGQTLLTMNSEKTVHENSVKSSTVNICESECKSTSRSLLAEMEETSEQEGINDESKCEQQQIEQESMEVREQEEESLLQKQMQEPTTSNQPKKRNRQEEKITDSTKNKKRKLTTNSHNIKKKRATAAADAARRFLHLQESGSNVKNNYKKKNTGKGNSAALTNSSVRWGSMDHHNNSNNNNNNNNGIESIKYIPYEMLEDTDMLYNDIERSLHDPDRIQAPPLYVGVMFHKYLPKGQNSLLGEVNMNDHHDMLADNIKSQHDDTHDCVDEDGNGNSLLSKWFKISENSKNCSENNYCNDADAEEEHTTSTRKAKINEKSTETDVLTNFSLSAKSSGKAHFVSTVDPRYAHKAVKYFVLRWKDKVYVLQSALSQNNENGFTFILRVLHSLPGVEVITFAAPTLLLPLLCYTAGTLETSCVSDVRLMAWMVHIVDHERTLQLHHQRTTNIVNNSNNGVINNKEESEEQLQEEEAKISDYTVLQRICLGREASCFVCSSPLQQLVHEVYYLAPLYRVLYGQLGTQALLQAFLRQEKRLSILLTSMKMCGVIVDLAEVHRFKISCTAQMQTIREEAAAFVPSLHDFNIQSHDHCRQAIYEILGLGRYLLDDNGITASSVSITRCGKLSTAEETLKQLARHHPFPQLLLNYRKVAKILQTYVEGMMSYAIPCSEAEALSSVGLTAKHIALAQMNNANVEINENTTTIDNTNNNINLENVNHKCNIDSLTHEDLFNDDSLLFAEESGSSNNNNNNETSKETTPIKSHSRQRRCSCHSSPSKTKNKNSNNNNNNSSNARSGLYLCKTLPTSGLARIHANFLQESTDTGRLSCVEPNLQNLPRNAIMMEELQQANSNNQINNLAEFDFRRCFVAPHSFTLLSVDYQQIELRVLAHLCEDQRLVLAMTNSTDIHRGIAQVIFNKADISDEERNFSKRVVFGVIYGAGARTVALQTKRTVAEAEQILCMLKTAFPQMEVYRQRVIECARHDGFVRTISGRRRYLPEINSNNVMRRTTAERQAFNTVVQGSAADVMKMAMLAIEKEVIRHYRHEVYLLTQIHDEVVFAVRKEHIAHVVRGITHAMSHALSILVPLIVTAKVGPSLGQLEEWSVDHELGVKTVM